MGAMKHVLGGLLPERDLVFKCQYRYIRKAVHFLQLPEGGSFKEGVDTVVPTSTNHVHRGDDSDLALDLTNAIKFHTIWVYEGLYSNKDFVTGEVESIIYYAFLFRHQVDKIDTVIRHYIISFQRSDLSIFHGTCLK